MRRGTTTTVMAGALAAAMAAGTALAGPGGPGRHGMHGRRGPLVGLLRAVHRLDLTEAQREKIRAILDAIRPKLETERQALRELRRRAMASDPASFDEAAVRALARERARHREEIAVTVARARADIFQVLTPEQRERLEAWRAARAERRRRMRQCMEELGPPPWAADPGPAPEAP